ncbi:MAG: exo-alpha-sialidase [Phycisphaerales bacterium]|nr:exo-alpha-sialidase [Phycisphaerales bacterium]
MSRSTIGVAARVLVAGACAGVTFAQSDQNPQTDDYVMPGVQPPVLEVSNDPYLPPTLVQSSPPAPGLSRGFGGVQVNVDANGNNILHDAANEPSLAIDPTAPNRMVIGWRQFDNIASDFRQAGNAWTNDGGRTWTFPGVFTPGTFRSDPVLDSDSSGNIYYSSLKGDFLVDTFISGDGGQHWGSPIPAYGGDKQWIVIDKTGGVGEGNFYQSWSTAAGCCGSRIFTRSTDGGQTYMNPITLPNSPVWGTMAIGSDGTLYLVGYDFNSGNVYCLRSTNAKNAGQTPTFQSTPVNLGAPFNLGGNCDPNPAGLWGQLWIAVDNSGGPYDGNVYIVASVDPSGTDPLDVRCAISTDGGVSFPTSTRVNDDSLASGHLQWFGTMSVAPDGRIDVVWNDTRDSNVCNKPELYYASSEDGGATWSPNVAVSPQWDSYLGWPQQQKIGDYYNMRSDLTGANLAWAATFNGEQDVYYLRIGDYDCNGNGIDDSVDLSTGISTDCNGNGIPDECDIAAGVLADANGNGIPDEC